MLASGMTSSSRFSVKPDIPTRLSAILLVINYRVGGTWNFAPAE